MSKSFRKDLTGRVFGSWVVISHSPNEKNTSYWLCRCKCGKEKIIVGTSLTSGTTKSCGCNQYENIVGKRFEKWIVISKTDKHDSSGNILYEVKCDCGTIKLKRKSHLISGESSSCGCGRLDHHIGKRYGKWTVIENTREQDDHGRYLLKVKCDCGTERKLHSGYLTSEKSTSCGCNIPIKDLTGQMFGKLKVIRMIEKEKITNTRYNINKEERTQCECICLNCDEIITIRASSLTTGNTRSCGCIKSLGEKIITEILKSHNIKFENNLGISECVSDIGAHLTFDFIIPNNKNPQYVIEFDGSQHDLNHKPHGYFTQEKLDRIRFLDTLKNNFCIKSNIPIIRIPYVEINNITLDMLIPSTSKYLLNNKGVLNEN